MDSGTRRVFIAAIALIVLATGGIALFLGGPGPTPTATLAPSVPPASSPGSASPEATGSPGASLAIPASPVRGVVVAVDSRGLDDVRAFTLRSDAGEILVFDLRELRDTATFPLGHLAEHQATAEPVLVTFRAADGVLLATAVDDA